MLGTILSAIAGAVLKHIRIAFERMAELARAKQSGADAATNAGRDDTLRRSVRRNEIDADVRDDSDTELDDRLRRPERRNNASSE